MENHWATSKVRVALAAGATAALGVAGLWFALTAITGKTYHLAPGVIAWLPGVAVGLAAGDTTDQNSRRERVRLGLAVSAVGLLIAAAGWVAILIDGIRPSATFFHGQPGGVAAEVVVIALTGAGLGTRRVIRARSRGGRSAARGSTR